jgi:hypothetical protein
MPSPANCNLEGTIAAFLDEAMKNAEIKITERKIRKIGLVVNALSPKIGGNSKSAALGGLKPSSESFTLKTDHLFHHPHGRSNDAQPYVQIRNLAKFLLPAKPDPNQVNG